MSIACATRRPTAANADTSPTWLEGLSPASLDVLAEVVRRSGSDLQAELIAGSRAGAAGGQLLARSRQAHHAHLMRARSTAAAGMLLLATEEPELRALLLSAELGPLRLLSAECQTKLFALTSLRRGLTVAGCTALFEAGLHSLLQLGPHAAQLPDREALRIHAALAAMYLGPMFQGESLREAYREAHRAALACGLLANSWLRLQLATIGSWAGEPGEHLACLFDAGMRDTICADRYGFVRRDATPRLYAKLASLVRGGYVDPASCLLSGRPSATMRGVIGFVLFALREARPLTLPAYTLMLLEAVEDVQRHVARMRADGAPCGGVGDLVDDLRRFERVERIEKHRFWALCERVPDDRLRSRLVELWQRDSAAGDLTPET